MADTPTLAPRPRGTLFLIGGGEDKDGRTTILDAVARSLKEAARRRPTSRLAIIPSAHEEHPLKMAAPYRKLFEERGLSDVEIAPIVDRKSAQSVDIASGLRDAAGIFFTGGDQRHLTNLLRDTASCRAIHQAYCNRAVVSGTSAGASAMSKHMVAGGHVHPPTNRGEIEMSPGLSLLPGIVIDQHFSQRRRIGRLVAVLVSEPGVLCLGIDENTAVKIPPGGVMRVMGEGSVTIFDGSNIGYCSRGEPDGGQPASVVNLTVHILVAGQQFDVEKRRMIESRPRSD